MRKQIGGKQATVRIDQRVLCDSIVTALVVFLAQEEYVIAES